MHVREYNDLGWKLRAKSGLQKSNCLLLKQNPGGIRVEVNCQQTGEDKTFDHLHAEECWRSAHT